MSNTYTIFSWFHGKLKVKSLSHSKVEIPSYWVYLVGSPANLPDALDYSENSHVEYIGNLYLVSRGSPQALVSIKFSRVFWGVK